MRWPLREKATRLRRAGWSYNVISQRIKVAKSTLSHWLREVPYSPNPSVARRIRQGPMKSAMRRHGEKLQKILTIKQYAAAELGQLSKRDLWMIGLGLYIGEGSKLYEMTQLVNSDPNVVMLSMLWLRKVCGLSNENFRIAIHLYPDTSKQAALRYWSKVCAVPASRFGKIQVDRRTNKSGKKHRKLPYGTVRITVKSAGTPQYGVALHRKIIGWIEAIYRQARV